MLYRTKKYLRKSAFYTVSIALTAIFYIEAAHRRILPAVFEYYTGEVVRKNTRPFFFEVKAPSLFFSIHDLLDILTREKGYMGGRKLLREILQSVQQWQLQAQEIQKFLSRDTSLKLWLGDPKGRFADVYKYEFLSQLENYGAVQAVRILDSQGGILYSAKNFESEKLKELKGEGVSAHGFRTAVEVDGKLLGMVEIIWNRASVILMASANRAGYQVFLLNESNHLVGTRPRGEVLSKFFFREGTNLRYRGVLHGRQDGYRKLAELIDGFYVVVVYEAVAWYYYFYYLIIYIALLFLGYLFYRQAMRLKDLWLTKRVFQEKAYLEEGLRQAIQINQEALRLVGESMLQMQKRQTQSLEFLAKFQSDFLAFLRSSYRSRPVEKTISVGKESKEPVVLEKENAELSAIKVVREIDLPFPNSTSTETGEISQDFKNESDREIHFPELSDEPDKELFADLPSDLTFGELSEPVSLTSEQSREIVDEFNKSLDDLPNLWLELQENLETGGLELVKGSLMTLHSEEDDFTLLSIDSQFLNEELTKPSTRPKQEEQEEREHLEPASFFFEDEDLENLSLEQILQTSDNKKEDVFFDYNLPLEMLTYEKKRKPLVLQEEIKRKGSLGIVANGQE
ncbi:MAG: hypothetical protein NZM25_01710 [Leptospiraceae bacterium]|nr:hypothetical protein [Leptospiraceae bacterium]MDW8306892.1 hypothetical protein [Leptospiraceae bacterium]